MFNFHSVNTSEVDSGSRPPEAPVLTILAGEDINTLSWTSPLFTDFFRIYWSNSPFTSINELGVHVIDTPTGLSPDPTSNISYIHQIPAVFSLSVLYYRVLAYNRNGSSLSNQEDNYNFKLAIYEEIYNKTLDDLLLRFTPEIRKQYEDSKLWRSFVQSLCSELAQGRFEIKEALKQLNLQKAIDVFLTVWNNLTGISRINVIDPDTGELVLEDDAHYRQRLVDNIFWDKISNLALKKTMLLKLKYEGKILDAGPTAASFKVIPEKAPTQLKANHGLMYMPGETINIFISHTLQYVYPVTCISDDGTTLTYENYDGPALLPTIFIGDNTKLFAAIPTSLPQSGVIELIQQGSFDTSSSMSYWSNLDSGNQGPANPATVTYRPTAYTPGLPPGQSTLTNPTYAFDNNINSYAQLQATSIGGFTDYVTYSGIPSQSGTPTSLNLIIKFRSPLCSVSRVEYSLNGGASWTITYQPGVWWEVYDRTEIIPLSTSQDLSQIMVRFFNGMVQTGEWGEIIQFYPTYIYDIRVEASGYPISGSSAWSSEYGGSMKLQYGIACREYNAVTSGGQACTLSFDVMNSAVTMRAGSSSGAEDLISENVYAPGSHSIGLTAAPLSTYIRFYIYGEDIGYVDNVSLLGAAPITSGTIKHGALYNSFQSYFDALPTGTLIEFVSQDGITKSQGKLVSNVSGILTFEAVGSLIPHALDYVKMDLGFGPTVTNILSILTSDPILVTSSNSSVHSKLLSNIYSVNLGSTVLPDTVLNDIYDEISPLGAIGNVLTKIIQDVNSVFEDWDTNFGNIPYGLIYFTAPSYEGAVKTTAGDNWAIGEQIYLDNQWTEDEHKTFYGNAGPDDFIILTRTW